MHYKASIAIVLAGLAAAPAQAAPGDYEPGYDQSGGYPVATLDERVAKLEKKLSGDSQLELLNRVEQLQNDVQRLRGVVEDLTHQLDLAKKQQKDQYLDLDRRLQAPAAAQPVQPTGAAEAPPAAVQGEIPAGSPAPTAAAPVPEQPKPAPAPTLLIPPPPPLPQAATPTPPARLPPATAPSPDAAARQAAYQKGFNALKASQYPEAIKEFKNFLSVYPTGEYSDNAAYWLAEAHYVNRDLAAAREAFRKVVKDYPQAAKVSDAQLKLGYIDYDTAQWSNARNTLAEVVKRYPDTSAAKLAQKRLDKMQQEGH
jgi:tol-pal system protein YbgF